MGGLNEKEHRDFWVFRDRSKNVIFGFFGVEKLIKIFVSSSRIIQNFEKIDLQSWNFRAIHRSHVTIFWIFFDANLFVGHQLRVHRGFHNRKVKRSQLRSNLKIRPKNLFSMTHTGLSHENFSIDVLWYNWKLAGVKFYLRSNGVIFTKNDNFSFSWVLAVYSINFLAR